MLKDYALDNCYTRESPQKNDTVFKRDYRGNYIVEQGERVKIQKVLISV